MYRWLDYFTIRPTLNILWVFQNFQHFFTVSLWWKGTQVDDNGMKRKQKEEKLDNKTRNSHRHFNSTNPMQKLQIELPKCAVIWAFFRKSEFYTRKSWWGLFYRRQFLGLHVILLILLASLTAFHREKCQKIKICRIENRQFPCICNFPCQLVSTFNTNSVPISVIGLFNFHNEPLIRSVMLVDDGEFFKNSSIIFLLTKLCIFLHNCIKIIIQIIINILKVDAEECDYCVIKGLASSSFNLFLKPHICSNLSREKIY